MLFFLVRAMKSALVPIFLSLSFKADAAEAVAPIALPGCPNACGNISIPFPFGTGANCFLSPWYEIKYKAFPPFNTSTRRPFLSKLDIEVLEIALSVAEWTDIPIQTITLSIPPLKACTSDTRRQRLSSIDLRGSPYNFSTDAHAFLMEGCAGSVAFVNLTEESMAGCTTVCHNNNNNTAISTANLCYGVECCQMRLPSTTSTTIQPTVAYNSPLLFFHIDFYGQSLGERRNCMVATLIKADSVDQYKGKLLSANPYASTVPMELIWSWVSSSFPDYNPHVANCTHDETINRTLCSCNNHYLGNPYIYDGCKAIVECCHCHGSCFLAAPNRYVCDPSTINPIVTSIMEVFVPIALGPLLLWFGCLWLRRFIRWRSKTEQRVKIFRLKLEQHQSTSEGVVERTKLFTHKQLDKATNHFNENRVLGKGGQGIVYKGMLEDGRTVAIKKLKKKDDIEMEQLINEVVILSQISHRNVVKLLGCCLEVDVPLLVYEYVSNGTLSQHIHDPDEDFDLSWAMRLKIAAGAAGAIAYLHSYSSIYVFHRDIKSSNILLDEKYRAKVSDFGCSKTASIDETHLTTLVRGTWGYLDPEYIKLNQFTDKSDVYSFGVVMLELLTRKKPVYKDDETMEHKSLVTEFQFVAGNSRSLFEFLDPQAVREAKAEQMAVVAELAKHCLNGSGRLRPSMKEVAMTLEMIMKSPPSELPTQEKRSFPDEELDEIAISEFVSIPLSAAVSSSLCIDVQPLLRDTI